jgi:hypothetical protein
MTLKGERIEWYEIQGKNFVFTGTLQSLTRDQATVMIEERGGRVHKAITKDVHYLIYGDKVGNTKWSAADRYGITKKSEQWFMAAMMATTPGFVPRKSMPDLKPISRAPEVEEAAPRQRRVRVQ